MAAVAEVENEHAEPEHGLSKTQQDYAIRTWRYLRLAMIGLVVGLLVAVVYEWRQVPSHCFQTSISAYWYTPVRGYFVGALLSIGTCLFCLKGNTEREDVFLNLAGMFAAVVALVPTPDAGTCSSVRGTTTGRGAEIANNGTALIAIGVFAVALLAILWLNDDERRRPRVEYAVAALVCVVAAIIFETDRDDFLGSAHDIAAYAMFGCILVVVVLNARDFQPTDRLPRNPYPVVALAMVVSAIGIIVAGLVGWSYWIIAVETAFIVLFAVFWVIQTVELWRPGLRR